MKITLSKNKYLPALVILGMFIIYISYTLLAAENVMNAEVSPNTNMTTTGVGDNNTDGRAQTNSPGAAANKKPSIQARSSSQNTTSQTNISEIKIVALGDSLTNAANLSPSLLGDNKSYSFATGTNVSSVYLYLKNKGLNIQPVNLAVSGAKSSDVLANQVPLVSSYSPQYVTLLIGGNDILSLIPNYVPVENFQTNLDNIVANIRSANRTILLATIPNYTIMRQAAACEGKRYPNEEVLLPTVLGQYNSAITNVGNKYGVKVIDLFPYLNASHISEYDCIHVNIAGEEKIAERFKTQL